MLGGGLLLFGAMAAILEASLALRGIRATVLDSPERWGTERERAAALGERALILVGASRIQLDADLPLLRRLSGLEPVQLAIDGSNFRPVLADLAADERIRGTVVVDVAEHALVDNPRSPADDWLEAHRRRPPGGGLRFDTVEPRLAAVLRQNLRSYADGARPLDSLNHRLLRTEAERQYVVMRPDRSRLADYSRVQMPHAYFGRVLRDLGEDVPFDPGMTLDDYEARLARRIEAEGPAPDAARAYRDSTAVLAAHAAAIARRGGRVLFVRLPSSGLLRELERRRHPRALWDGFAAGVGAAAVHFEDVPEWRDLKCPDGSHLDFRQREPFTRGLARLLEAAPR